MPKPITKKAFIIDCICKMDLELLMAATEDSELFMRDEKLEFFKRLEEIFFAFQKQGDSELIPKRGKCTGKFCPNKTCGGTSFVGNNSKQHIAFVIREEGAEIVEMVYCDSFQIYDYGMELKQKLSFSGLQSMLGDTRTTLTYIQLMRRIEAAYNDFKKIKGSRLIATSHYQKWVKKQEQLQEDIKESKLHYLAFLEFQAVYKELNDLVELLPFTAKAEKILEAYKTLPLFDEASFLHWLCTGEELALLILEKEYCIFKDYTGPYEGFCRLLSKYDFYIASDVFDSMRSLQKLLQQHYKVYFNRYKTMPDSRIAVLKEKLGEECLVDRLSYHLRVRKLI